MKAKNKKGFTLVEVLISVVMLSVISGFILQIFIVSANANERAREMDYGKEQAKYAIELLKGQDSFQSYAESGFFLNAYDYKPESDDSIDRFKIYGEDWVELPADNDIDLESFISKGAGIPDNAMFVLRIMADNQAATGEEGLDAGTMCAIKTKVYARGSNGEFDSEKELVGLTASKYFPFRYTER